MLYKNFYWFLKKSTVFSLLVEYFHNLKNMFFTIKYYLLNKRFPWLLKALYRAVDVNKQSSFLAV